jgi:hypothetical protein
MHSHTITLALAAGIATFAPAAALAQPIDAPQTAQARQDLRPPDVIDAAAGRGTYNSPRVVVVRMPGSESTSPGGMNWADAGIGAGGLLGITLIGAGGALAFVHRRRITHHAPPVPGL